VTPSRHCVNSNVLRSIFDRLLGRAGAHPVRGLPLSVTSDPARSPTMSLNDVKNVEDRRDTTDVRGSHADDEFGGTAERVRMEKRLLRRCVFSFVGSSHKHSFKPMGTQFGPSP
jgi:hypothetical protein